MFSHGEVLVLQTCSVDAGFSAPVKASRSRFVAEDDLQSKVELAGAGGINECLQIGAAAGNQNGRRRGWCWSDSWILAAIAGHRNDYTYFTVPDPATTVPRRHADSPLAAN